MWPAHVGGSLCGGAGLSAKTSSTIGFERRHNPLLSARRSAVRGGADREPAHAPTERRSHRRAQPPTTSTRRRRSRSGQSESDVGDLLARGVTVLDAVRRRTSISPTWPARSTCRSLRPASGPGPAGRCPPDDQMLLVASRCGGGDRGWRAALQAVGFSELAGFSVADEFAWCRGGAPRCPGQCLGPRPPGRRAASGDGEPDRRARGSMSGLSATCAGSMNLPLHRLREVAPQDLPDDGRATAVACAAGARAAFAASLLRRSGRPDVVRIGRRRSRPGLDGAGARGRTLRLDSATAGPLSGPAEPLHPKDAVAHVGQWRVGRRRQRQPEDVARVAGIDHAVIPEPGGRVVRMALALVLVAQFRPRSPVARPRSSPSRPARRP